MLKLKLKKYTLLIQVTQTMELPDYSGSTFRGALGHALIKNSGITHKDIQAQNLAYLKSPYSQIFQLPEPNSRDSNKLTVTNPPARYIIQAPLNQNTFKSGETFNLNLTLFDTSLDHLELILKSLDDALQQGLGKNQAGKGFILKVAADKQTNFTNSEKPQDLELDFLTPLRIKHQRKIIQPHQLTAQLLVTNALRRISLTLPNHPINQEEITQLIDQAKELNYTNQLTQHNWARYSNRQNKLIQMNGATGKFTLQQTPPQLTQLLEICQLLHLGKGTVYGLGRYQLIKI